MNTAPEREGESPEALTAQEAQTLLDDVRSGERERQGEAFTRLRTATDRPVPWAYDLWDDLVDLLDDRNNRTRSIAAQLLSNLAKSDPDARILRDFDELLAVTRDDRFVTARHCMQSLWKVGVVGAPQRERLMEGLEGRFFECSAEKHTTLIRYDILECMRKVYDQVAEPAIRQKASGLIEEEEDPRYRKKYHRLWPNSEG